MSMWDAYGDRMAVTGKTKRDYWVNHAQSSIARRLQDSPSCRTVLIDGEEQTVSITHHAEDGYKRIASLPGERLKHGGLVDFADSKWLIVQIDADDVIYQRGIMRRCNYILRWVSNKTGEIREKWCVVEDGTKYLIGERTREFLTIGDGRMAVTIAKDDDTVELQRGLRFLIDDEDSDFVTAYQITKSNKLYNVYNGEGVFRFIMNEVQLTDDDDVERRIADFKSRMKDPDSGVVGTLLPPVFPDYYLEKEAHALKVTAADKEEAQEPEDEQGGWI